MTDVGRQAGDASAGARLRQLLEGPACLVLPGVYDALTAKLAERAGFEAIYLTGSGVSYSQLGLPDLSYVGLRDMLDRAWTLAGAVSIPILADADTGYGGPLNVIHTISEYERAGLAGAQIEDQGFPKRCGHYVDQRLVSSNEMVAKIHAGLDARRDPSFMIVARTDARGVHGLDEAIRRAEAYGAAGADVIFVEALRSPAEMRAVTASVGVPVMANMVEGGRSPLLSATELAKLGFRMAIFPNAVARAAAFAAAGVLAELRATGSTAQYLPQMFDFDQMSDIVGLPEALAAEEKYDLASELSAAPDDGQATRRHKQRAILEAG
jgi:2-methylisocitrate lyase-like PEP mutase family enzyme